MFSDEDDSQYDNDAPQLCEFCGSAECRCENDNCCQFVHDGFIYCSAIGSEDCDWCPHHDEIGTRIDNQPPAEAE